MFEFNCKHCGREISTADGSTDTIAHCPHCGSSQPLQTAPTLVATNDAAIPIEAMDTIPPRTSHPTAVPIVEAPVPPRSRDETVSPLSAGGHGGQTAETLHVHHISQFQEERELYDFLAPAESPDELGRLGTYRVLKVLGQGGMGVVYKAEDTQLQRPVAHKAILPTLGASASARQRFLREARAAAKLKHDHVVTIYHVGEDRGVPYIAMEFLDGEPMDKRLDREQKLSTAEVLRIGREIADGLAAAHEQALVHRDIKPANVWLEGERARVKILDFGLARASDDQQHLTQEGAIVGTPAYMAPEQVGGKPVDSRCDLFSLGCVLYTACTGKAPFIGADTISTLMAVATDEPPTPRELNPKVPKAVSNLVMHLLAKKPEDRPASAKAVVKAIRKIEEELTRTVLPDAIPVAASKTPKVKKETPAEPPVPKRRKRPFVMVGSVLMAMLVGLAGFLLWDRYNSKRAPSNFLEAVAAENDPHGGSPPDSKVEEKEPKNADVPKKKLDPKVKAPEPKTKEPETPPIVDSDSIRRIAPSWTTHAHESGKHALVSLSPDGATLVSGASDGKLKVWRLADGTSTSLSVPALNEITHVSVSGDGRKFLTLQSSRRAVAVWDAANHTKWTLPNEKDRFGRHLEAGLSGTGRRLAINYGDRGVGVWDTVLKEEKFIVPADPGAEIHGLTVSFDGHWLAAKEVLDAKTPKTVALWDLSMPISKPIHSHFVGDVRCLVFSKQNDRLFGVCGIAFHRWQLPNLKEQNKASRLDIALRGPVAIAEDMLVAGVASDQRTVAVCDGITGQRKATLMGADSDILSLAITPDGKTVAASSIDGTFRVWRIAEALGKK